jgi:hypothetical protein
MTTDTVRQARERVEQKLGLAVHWLVYVVVNTGLVIAAGGIDGSGWRLAGWGLGLAVHTAYVVGDLRGLRERLVRREMERGSAR